MGEIVLKEIKMTLDESSIDAAIDEINHLQWHLRDAMDALVDYLLREGVTIARLNLMSYGLRKTGTLYRSIHVEKADGTLGQGYIVAGTPGDINYDGGNYGSISYAVFVEFGFGTGNYYRKDGSRIKNLKKLKTMPQIVASSDGRTSEHPAATGRYTYKKAGQYNLIHNANGGFRGWIYKNREDGKFYVSRGQPPKPFMYNTLMDLTARAEKEGGRIIAQYIP